MGSLQFSSSSVGVIDSDSMVETRFFSNSKITQEFIDQETEALDFEENWRKRTPDLLEKIYIDDDKSKRFIHILFRILRHVTDMREVDEFVEQLLCLGFLAHVQARIEALDDYALSNPSLWKNSRLLEFLSSCTYRSEEMCRALINKKFHITVVKN